LLENGVVKLPSREPKEVELEAVLLSAAGLDFGLARFGALLEAAGFFAALRFLAPPLFAFFRAGAAFFALLFVLLFLADVFVFLALVFVLPFFIALAMIFLLVILP
jgi:hypothetical protein